MKKLVSILLILALFAGTSLAETPDLDDADLPEWSMPTNDGWVQAELPESEETIIMGVGARNQGVTMLQKALISRGYLSGEADGSFGSGTQAAVQAFQSAEGMVADGYVRLSTLKALDPENAGTTLDSGSKGLLVYGVQKLLNVYGFLGDSPDARFGSGTKRAMRIYMERVAADMAVFVVNRAEEQRAHFDALAQEDASSAVIIDVPIATAETVQNGGAVTPEWLDYMIQSSVPQGAVVGLDDRGADVYRMQRRLKALGYMAAGVDGVFGSTTELALKYFQRRNHLDESGVCDENTQRRLYTDIATASDIYVSPYAARVSTKKNRVYIYKWTGEKYGDLVKTFVCTTGKASTPTIKGTFQAPGQNGVWYHMTDSHCWVMYAFVIDGGTFFHSVLFNNKGDKRPTEASLANLGRSASHGCVRLSVADAKWLYENCAPGMTVVIE